MGKHSWCASIKRVICVFCSIWLVKILLSQEAEQTFMSQIMRILYNYLKPFAKCDLNIRRSREPRLSYLSNHLILLHSVQSSNEGRQQCRRSTISPEQLKTNCGNLVRSNLLYSSATIVCTTIVYNFFCYQLLSLFWCCFF